MSIMVGVGRGAQAGVLIKNAEALERMEKVDTLVVDKTGTLTEGKPKVVADRDRGGLRRRRSAAAGRQPRARQRASARRARSSRPPREREHRACAESPGFDSPTGKGVSGTVEGQRLAAGQRALPRRTGVDTAALDDEAERLREDGATAILLAVDGKRRRPSSPSPIRSRRRRRDALAGAAQATACASSC